MVPLRVKWAVHISLNNYLTVNWVRVIIVYKCRTEELCVSGGESGSRTRLNGFRVRMITPIDPPARERVRPHRERVSDHMGAVAEPRPCLSGRANLSVSLVGTLSTCHNMDPAPKAPLRLQPESSYARRVDR